MAGFTALMCGWGIGPSAPPPDPYNKKVIFAATGTQRFRLRGDIAGLVPNGNSSNAPYGLPAGFRYGIKPGGEVNYPGVFYDTPWELAGAAVVYNTVRQTLCIRVEFNPYLLSSTFGQHLVMGCRHKGTQYHTWKDNRSDAALIGSLGARDRLLTIEGIEGLAADNAWPVPIANEYRNMLDSDPCAIIIESLQYDQNPTCRVRYINRRNGVMWDSGAVYPTGSPFTQAHASILFSLVDMQGGTNAACYADVTKIVNFMTGRDTEVPLATIRDAIEI